MSEAKTTTDHREIQKWVEARGGIPAHVKRTGRGRGDLGVLRIDYPGFSGEESLLVMEQANGIPPQFKQVCFRRVGTRDPGYCGSNSFIVQCSFVDLAKVAALPVRI